MGGERGFVRGFVIAGAVTAWDSRQRLLEIGEYVLTVAPEVAVSDLVSGQRVTAAGHHTRDGLRVVTQLVVR